MRALAPPLLIALLADCSSTPVSDSPTTATSAGDLAPKAICVVSMDGGARTCTDPPAPPRAPDSDEPCIERDTGTAFTHGPGTRIHAFCSPKESARKVGTDADEDTDDEFDADR